MKFNRKISFPKGPCLGLTTGVFLSLLTLIGLACSSSSTSDQVVPVKTVISKFSIWTGKTKLRGANIWQTRVYGTLFQGQIGAVPVGPAYTQADFDHLAEMGANYVNISHPGLYSESSPFSVDTDARDNLDSLLTMIADANMFAVICFRTGPGRSEFTFARDEVDDWFTSSDLDETVWSESDRQTAWVNMWIYTAGRYKDNAIVVGYDLMVEPNSDEISAIEAPEDFYPDHAGNLEDWNQFFPAIITGIRTVDKNTPILVGGMGYSAVEWLPHIVKSSDPRTLYTIHQYAPYVYTHQDSAGTNTYPGTYDVDWDSSDDTFNKTWLNDLLTTADALGLTIAVNEFGVIRWIPNASDFMADSFSLFEQRNWNHALWQLYPASYPADSTYDGEFNFMFGPTASNYSDVSTSDLISTIKANWEKNVLRPSIVTFSSSE